MTERMRVPMERNGLPTMGDEHDVAVAVPPLVGQRFTMDVSEERLARMGREGIAHAVETLSRTVVYENEPAIRRAIESYLTDRKWAEPIIRQAIRDAVREFVFGMMATGLADEEQA